MVSLAEESHSKDGNNKDINDEADEEVNSSLDEEIHVRLPDLALVVGVDAPGLDESAVEVQVVGHDDGAMTPTACNSCCLPQSGHSGTSIPVMTWTWSGPDSTYSYPKLPIMIAINKQKKASNFLSPYLSSSRNVKYLVSQTSARWRPVTVPSLAASLCIMRPSRVAHIRTQRSLYSTTVPDWRSDSTLPGSNYAMDIRKPGTEKASFRKMNFKLVPASFE